MPFFFKFYVFGTISFFKKTIYAFKNNKVFRSIETVVALSAFDFFRKYYFLAIKID